MLRSGALTVHLGALLKMTMRAAHMRQYNATNSAARCEQSPNGTLCTPMRSSGKPNAHQGHICGQA
eukprot:7319705-Lingulodinium_polyedra.AAC.1